MWTESAEGRKLIRELSKEIVIEIAPEEMDLFDELVEEYFEDPSPPKPSSPQRDDPLGFGIEESLVAATPAAAAVVSVVINYLLSEFLKVAESERTEQVKRRIKDLFGSKKREKVAADPLTKEQLEEIRKLARKQAIVSGMKPEKADQMANALIGSLVLD